jgi:hypothetical protein
LKEKSNMRFPVSARNLVVSGALCALLAGCAGAGSPIALQAAPNASAHSPAGASGFMRLVDPKTQLVYMSSWGTSSLVNVFTMTGKQVGQIINGLENASPEGLFVDAKSNLWVAAGSTGQVLVYPRGVLSPSEQLTDPVGIPIDVTVCSDGTAYVANLYNTKNTNTASVQVYPPGSTKPTRTLEYAQDFRNSFVACDAAGNVFVALLTSDSVGAGRVIEFPGGKKAGAKDLGITLQVPGGIEPDPAGNLLVTDLSAETITEYTEAGVPTGHSIGTGTNIEGIAVSRDGQVVIGAAIDLNEGIAWSFPGGKEGTVFSCCSRIGPPFEVNYGVAIDPGQSGV